MHLSNLFMQNMSCEMLNTFKIFCIGVRLKLVMCAPCTLRPHAPQCTLHLLKISFEGSFSCCSNCNVLISGVLSNHDNEHISHIINLGKILRSVGLAFNLSCSV